MNFKIIALRKKMELMPLGNRIIDPSFDPEIALEDLVLEIQASLRKDKELSRTTFFSMVPDEYRAHVNHIAEKAYRERGITDMTYEEFRELIAENWLLKRALFTRIASDFGFKKASTIHKSTNAAALILTMSASIVVISKPEKGLIRSILYMRIKERESHRIPLYQRAELGHEIVLGNRVVAGDLNSSPVIDILVDPNADLDRLSRASEVMSRSFHTVDHHTINIIFNGDDGGGNKLVN